MAHYVAIRNGMSNAQEDDLMHIADDFFGTNSGIVGSSDYEVTQSDPVGMSVTVASGKAYVWCTTLNTHMRTYLDSDVQLSIDSNTSGSTRYDIICIKIDVGVSPDADGSNVASVVVVKGTPGSGVPSTPANHYKLAEVEVADGATEITNSNITDTREKMPYLKEHGQDGSHSFDSLSVDTISEKTSGSGVTIDGLLIKDSQIQKSTPFYTATDGSTITFDLAVSRNQIVTLGGNRTLAVSNASPGMVFLITLKQDSTGGRTVTWWSGISWVGGSVPTLTTAANKADTFGFICTGTNTYYGYIVGQNI